MNHQSGQRQRRVAFAVSASTLACFAVMIAFAEEDRELGVNHAECSFLGTGPRAIPQDRFVEATPRSGDGAHSRGGHKALRRTTEARHHSGGSRTEQFQNLEQFGTIDKHLFQAMQDARSSPGGRTNDFEFIPEGERLT